MGCYITMPDGKRDCWGYSYLASVAKDIQSFDAAISQLDKVIEKMEDCKARFDPLPEQAEELWDDYWHAQDLRKAFEWTQKEFGRLEDLKTARNNLKRLVDAVRWVYDGSHGKELSMNWDLKYN